MTEAEAGSCPEVEARAALEARLAAVHDLLERARRALATGELTELAGLDRLTPLLQGVADRLGRLPQVDHRLRGRLLVVLDEVGGLTEALRRQHARLAVQLRTAGAHRRAGTAYRRAGRL